MDGLRAGLTTGAWVPTGPERVLAEQIVRAIGQPCPPDQPFSAVTLAIREGLHTAGPDVAPADGDARLTAALVRSAALLEPHRVADSPEGQDLARHVMRLCTAVQTIQPAGGGLMRDS